MTTLSVTPTTHNNHTVLWDGAVVGKISFNIGELRWEYSRYSQYPTISHAPTAEGCIQAAQRDHANAHKPEPELVTITDLSADPQPLYILHRTTWKSVGSGRGRVVVVSGGLDVIVPETLAPRLRVGQVVELHHDRLNGLFLRLSKKPILRPQTAANCAPSHRA